MELFKVAQFFVSRLIAEGGQAKVYEALKDSKVYAIKIYNTVNERENLLFLQEKELMESLNHKCIFSPLEYRANETIIHPNQQTQNRNIVIMNYMRNGDLMNFVIKNSRLDPRVILRITRSILECLQYLSSQGIYHCDLKLQNVLLDFNYKPLLIDFGYVVSMHSTKQKEFPKQYYIAPEVKKGLPYNQKSEAFSLGVIIFILTVGRLPFKYTKHTDTSYRPLLEGKHSVFWKQFQQNLNFTIQQKIKQAIINLLQPNPKRRWSFSQLKQSEWFNQDPISEKEYFQYFNQRFPQNFKLKKDQFTCEFPFTDSQSSGVKETTYVSS